MNFPGSPKSGFTLVELLIVIVIIGILAGLIVVSTGSSRNRARDARRMEDFRQLQSAQEMVLADDEKYMKSAATGSIPAVVNVAGHKYLMPLADPANNANYKYLWIPNDADCGSYKAGGYYCAVMKFEERGACPAGFNRYYAASNKGGKEICAAADYAANPPSCFDCLAFF